MKSFTITDIVDIGDIGPPILRYFLIIEKVVSAEFEDAIWQNLCGLNCKKVQFASKAK